VQPSSSQIRKHSCAPVLGLLTGGLIIVVLLLSKAAPRWDFDLAFSRLWWCPPHLWFGDRSVVCWFLNHYGAWPGVLLAVGALVVFAASLARKKQRHLMLPALYVMLTFLLGPGLLVNGVLKHSWSRARPRDVVEFGRKERYEPVLTTVEGSHGRSFPSGHVSAAFFLCSLGFASGVWGTRQDMWAGLALGAAWGALVAWSRIASGAHFLTDVLWSATFIGAVNFLVLLPFMAYRRPKAMETIAPATEGPMKACF